MLDGSYCEGGALEEAESYGGEIVSSIETVFEFGEVARHMLTVDGAVGSGDGGLDVAKGGVDPFEGRSLDSPGSRTCLDDLMRTSGIGHAGETAQAIADHGAVRAEAAFGEGRDRWPGEAGNPPQLEANRFAIGGGFHRRGKRCFTGCATAPLAAPALAAEVGAVDFDTPAECLGAITFEHDLLQLVLDLPGGGLGHAKAAAEFDAGDALFALGEMIDRTKPKPQRHFAGGKDRPGDQRGLPAAGGALKQITALHHAVPRSTAGGTREAVRPPRSHDNGSAFLLAAIVAFERWLAEAFLELHRVARHYKTPLKSIMYPICTINQTAEQGA